MRLLLVVLMIVVVTTSPAMAVSWAGVTYGQWLEFATADHIPSNWYAKGLLIGNMQGQYAASSLKCPTRFSANMVMATLTSTPRIIEEDKLLTLAVLRGMMRLGCTVEE